MTQLLIIYLVSVVLANIFMRILRHSDPSVSKSSVVLMSIIPFFNSMVSFALILFLIYIVAEFVLTIGMKD